MKNSLPGTLERENPGGASDSSSGSANNQDPGQSTPAHDGRTPFISFLLSQNLLSQEDVFLVDVGASGGIDPLWFAFESRLRAVGFDPLVNEVTRLNQTNTRSRIQYVDAFLIARDYEQAFPQALAADKIGSRSNSSFERSSAARASELARMNYPKDVFNSGQELVFSSRRIELDDYFQEPERSRIDFIKIDTDGSDYQVLTGARQLLEAGAALGISIECQFHGPVHNEANLFCNIDRFLRAHGFSLYDLEGHHYSRGSLPQPFVYDIPAQTLGGQLQWGEALYFRDLADPEYSRMWGRQFDLSKKLKLACLFELFHLPDCAVELLLRNRAAFEAVLPLERCLDLLTPPRHGKRLRYSEYDAEFVDLVSQRKWLRFGRVPDKKLVSLVIPLLNEEAAFGQLTAELTKLAQEISTAYNVEILLIDDGSTDGTWEKIVAFAGVDPHVRGFSFSRNFGHQAALSFGYEAAKGEAVITLDGDLQDPPETVLAMLEAWEKGSDIVYGVRESRSAETWFKLATASMFYRLMKRLSKTKAPLDAGDFRLMSRRSVDALRSLPEVHRYLRGMVGWLGFKTEIIRYHRAPRVAGATKFSFVKMLNFAVDGLISFSTAPLRFFYLAGLISMLPFLGYLGYALYAWIFHGEKLVPGWASLLLCIVVFGALNLVCLGVMGEYIGRIYEQSKTRPSYIVARSTEAAETKTVGR